MRLAGRGVDLPLFGTAFRSAGTLTATAILIFSLIIAVSGAFSTRAEIRSSFDRQKSIQRAQLQLEELLKVQLDEETSVRGYAITGDASFLDPYNAAITKFLPLQKQLAAVLHDEQLQQGQAVLHEFDQVHEEWHRNVAVPLIQNPKAHSSIELEKRGKALIDQERSDATALEEMLAARNDVVGQQTQDEINRTLYVRAAWLIIFGLLAILFNTYRARLNRELEQERTTTETLQRAFQSGFEPLPHCEIGSAYISATRNTAVGGDVFDVYRLSNELALVLIADVSGKGIDAAVITAFIKFTIRGIALRRRDPSAILAEFNTAFPRAVPNPYLFVSMLVGILDFEKMSFVYASGGHDSAYVRRRDGAVEQLQVTGPILGVMEEPFATRTVRLESGDAVVLATDGMTEARDTKGVQLQEQALEFISRSTGTAQQIVDSLIRLLHERTRSELADDVAILCIKVGAAEHANA
ncbi:MAG: SpoIIE family protein phosphatase [Candidatus Eremiobacteraeota bacterium]|nr:SpoIIE family protein phosphatase [Candidatus Eremiobacteraeota bacterium]